jgi:hypothetical protein
MADKIVDLARAVYLIIRPCSETPSGSISYGDVCRGLPPEWNWVTPDSEILATALGIIVERCRAAGLPALSAVVVHAGGDHRPGNGYFVVAHPGDDDPLKREIAWANEFQAVHKAKYPQTLEELVPAGSAPPAKAR